MRIGKTARGGQNHGFRSGHTTPFSRDASGNVAIWFSLLLAPMLGFTFGAIKFAEASKNRSDLVDALESAALAVARRADTIGVDPCDLAADENGSVTEQDAYDELVAYGQEFFARNFAGRDGIYADQGRNVPFDPETHLTFAMNCAVVIPEAEAYFDLGPVLSNFFDTSVVSIGEDTEVSLPGAGRIELALVLDTTGSMDWCPEYGSTSSCSADSRMDVLKDAVELMLDNLYGEEDDATNDFVRTAIVPFNTGVNINPDAWFRDSSGAVTATGQEWMDVSAGAIWHGWNFLHVEWDESQKSTGNGSEFTIDVDRKVSHFDLYDSIDADHAIWKGCVEARPFPLDESDAVPGTAFSSAKYDAARTKPSNLNVPSDISSTVSARIDTAWNDIPEHPDAYTLTELAEVANTRFVPWFAPDEVDCGTYACGGFSSQSGWQRAHIDSSEFDDDDQPDSSAYPQFIYDGPDWGVYHHQSHYYNSWVPDYRYANVRHGNRAGSEPYRNFVLHYRTVYRGEHFESGDSSSGGLADCQTEYMTYSYDPNFSAGMSAAIDRFGLVNCRKREYVMRQAWVGIWDATEGVYKGKYDYPDGYSSTADGDSTRQVATTGPNNGCSTPLLPLSTDKSTILGRVDQMIPGGGTNTSVGAAWGWRVLSARAPFTEGSDPSTTDGRRWRKFMVLMTDGENSVNGLYTHGGSNYDAYGYSLQDRLNVLPSSAWHGTHADDYYEAEFDNKTIRICHRARSDGIKVYAIGFAIEADGEIEKALKACAIEEDAYFRADNAQELNDAFSDITDQVVELHVSG